MVEIFAKLGTHAKTPCRLPYRVSLMAGESAFAQVILPSEAAIDAVKLSCRTNKAGNHFRKYRCSPTQQLTIGWECGSKFHAN